jgi:hypothetical protein
LYCITTGLVVYEGFPWEGRCWRRYQAALNYVSLIY